MNRCHIAVITAPGRAHIYPVLGLCIELIKRGHRVTCAADSDHASYIHETGAEPVVYTLPKIETTNELNLAFRLPPSHPSWWVLCATVLCPWLVCTTAVTVPQLERFYKTGAPKLILYDPGALAGHIISRRLGCRAIQVHPGFFRQEEFLYWKDGVSYNPPPVLEFMKILDSLLWAYGIEEKNSLWHAEDLNITVVPRAFQYHADLFDERRYCFAGPFLNRPFKPVWRDNSDGKPIILISDATGSSDSSYFNVFVEALRGSKYHVILSVDQAFPLRTFQRLPGNFEINQHASLLEIIPCASLLICQAGGGSVLEALHYGIPLITLPAMPWHREVAWRVTELGLGISLPRETVTSDIVKESVEAVLGDAALANRVRMMQQEFRNAGGAPMAADRIEEFLQSRG